MTRMAYLSTDPGILFGGTKGASVHMAEVVTAIAAHDCEVLVLVAGIAPGFAPPAGLAVEVLPGPGKGASTTERLGFEEALTSWLARRLAEFGPIALYERVALHSAAGSVVAGQLGIPHLLELNAPLLEEAARYRSLEAADAADRLERQALAGADLVFAVSPPLAAYAAQRGARRVEVLQNAAAVERFPHARGTGRSPVAVFAGSLRPWHGIETIAEAWRLMGASAPSLLVLGDGPSRHLLDGLDAVRLGAVPSPQVPGLLASADIGLAPYGERTPRYFSPLKLFEYLAAGLATVVADLPAVRAVVDRDTAVVIAPGHARGLADAVEALCDDPVERRRLGRNGRALVERAHTWTHRARRILAAAAEVSAGLPPPGGRAISDRPSAVVQA